jgi:putative FmdB family regulatory protein
MPQYDYHCENCAHDFTVDLSISAHEEKEKNREIHCPKCDSQQVKHVIQSVNVMTSKKS